MNPSIYLVIGVASVALVLLAAWPYMWEGEFLGKWSSVVAILSLVGAPIAYFARQHEKEREIRRAEAMERKRASRNLHGELYDTLHAIEGDEFPEDLIDVTANGRKITFTNRFLNHDIYDSLVFSGEVKFLDYEIHQKIQDIFNMIKRHNHYLGLTIESRDNEKISKAVMLYYELLDKYERQLLEDIPGMIRQLEKKFGAKPAT